jgi:hypothetical protein
VHYSSYGSYHRLYCCRASVLFLPHTTPLFLHTAFLLLVCTCGMCLLHRGMTNAYRACWRQTGHGVCSTGADGRDRRNGGRNGERRTVLTNSGLLNSVHFYVAASGSPSISIWPQISCGHSARAGRLNGGTCSGWGGVAAPGIQAGLAGLNLLFFAGSRAAGLSPSPAAVPAAMRLLSAHPARIFFPCLSSILPRAVRICAVCF